MIIIYSYILLALSSFYYHDHTGHQHGHIGHYCKAKYLLASRFCLLHQFENGSKLMKT